MPFFQSSTDRGRRSGSELLALAAIYVLINFVLTPNGPYPVQFDDFSMLGMGVADLGWWWKRPVTANLVFLIAELGRDFAYFVLNTLTVLTAWLVLRFAARVFETEFRWFFVLVFAVLTFSHAVAFEHGRYFGLMTNLISHTFGLWTLLLLWDGWRRASNRHWLVAALTYALSVFAKEDFILPPLLLVAYFWVAPHAQSALSQPGSRRRGVLLTLAFIAIGVGSLLWGVLDRNPFVSGLFASDGGNRPYAVDLGASALLRAYWKLVAVLVPVSTTLAGFAAVVVWVTRPHMRRQLLMYMAMIAVLVLPYALLPNRLAGYRAYAWLPWLGAITVVALQVLATRAVGSEASAGRARPGWIGVTLMLASGVAWFNQAARMELARSYQQGEAINRRIVHSLEENRVAIAAAPVVGLFGLGKVSPWCGNDALYVNNKLGFDNRWMIFVEAPSQCYSQQAPDRKKRRGINVSVVPVARLCAAGSLPVLDVAADGSAVLRQAKDWCKPARPPQG